MNAESLCAHIIQLIHVPIHIFDGNGKVLAVHTDHGEQQDVFSCDNSLTRQILEKKTAKSIRYFSRNPTRSSTGSSKGQIPYTCWGRAASAAKKQRPLFIYEAATDRNISKEELLRKNFVNDEMIHSIRRHLSIILTVRSLDELCADNALLAFLLNQKIKRL